MIWTRWIIIFLLSLRCGCLAVLIYFCCRDISQGESNPGKCPETRVISRMSLSVLAAPMSPCFRRRWWSHLRPTSKSYQHQDTLLQRPWCLWFHHVVSHEPQHQQPLFIVSQPAEEKALQRCMTEWSLLHRYRCDTAVVADPWHWCCPSQWRH